MDPFDKKPFVPIDVMIMLGINIVVAVLGYYLIMACQKNGSRQRAGAARRRRTAQNLGHRPA
jgi:hypothetical protein